MKIWRHLRHLIFAYADFWRVMWVSWNLNSSAKFKNNVTWRVSPSSPHILGRVSKLLLPIFIFSSPFCIVVVWENSFSKPLYSPEAVMIWKMASLSWNGLYPFISLDQWEKCQIQQGRNFSSFPLGPIMSFKINFSQEIKRRKRKNFCLPHCGKIRYFVQKFLHF